MTLFAFAANELSIGEAILLSLVGFAVVFIVLFFLIFMIKAMSAIFKTKKAPLPSPVDAIVTREEIKAVSTAGMVPAPGSSGEIELNTVDDRTAALIMAIVADDLKVPLNELRFISIAAVHN